jgi:hypothetical protein
MFQVLYPAESPANLPRLSPEDRKERKMPLITQNTNNKAVPPFTHSSSSPAQKYEPRTAMVPWERVN